MTMFTTTTTTSTANPTRCVLLVTPAAAADKPQQDHCHIDQDDQQNNHHNHHDRSTTSTSTMIMDTNKADNIITSPTRAPTPTASTTPPHHQNQNGHYSHNHTASSKEAATNKGKEEQQDKGIQSEKKDEEVTKHSPMENDFDTNSRIVTRIITTEEQQTMEDPQTKKNMSSLAAADELQQLREENVELKQQVDELTYHLQMCRSEKSVLKQKCTSLELQLAHHCKVGDRRNSNEDDAAVVQVAADRDCNSRDNADNIKIRNAEEEEMAKAAFGGTETEDAGTETGDNAEAGMEEAEPATGDSAMTSMLLQMLQDMEQERNLWKTRALDMKQKYTELLKEKEEEAKLKEESKSQPKNEEVVAVTVTKTPPSPVVVKAANTQSQTSPTTATAPRKVVIRRSTMSHTTTVTESQSSSSNGETILTHKFGQPSPAATTVAPSSNNTNAATAVASENSKQEELPAEVWKERAYQMKAKVNELKSEQLKLNEALRQYQQYLQIQQKQFGNGKLPVPLHSTPQPLPSSGGMPRNTITHSNCSSSSSSDQRNTSTTTTYMAPVAPSNNGNSVKHNAAATTTASPQQGLIRRGTLTMYYAKQPQQPQRLTKRGSTTGGIGTTTSTTMTDDRFVIRKSSVSSVTSTSSSNAGDRPPKMPPTHRFGEYSWRSTPAELNEEEAKSLRRASLTSSQGSIDLEELNAVMSYSERPQQNATWNIVRPPTAGTTPFMSSQQDLPSTRRFGENPHPSTATATSITLATPPTSTLTTTTTTTRRFGENPHPSTTTTNAAAAASSPPATATSTTRRFGENPHPAATAPPSAVAAVTTTPLASNTTTTMTRPAAAAATAPAVFETSLQPDVPSTRRFGENPHPSSKKPSTVTTIAPESSSTISSSKSSNQEQHHRRRMSLDPSMLQNNMSPRVCYNGNELTAEGKPVTRKFGQNSSGHRRYSMSEGGSTNSSLMVQASTAARTATAVAEANAAAGTKEDIKKVNDEEENELLLKKMIPAAPVQQVPTVPLKTSRTAASAVATNNALTSCELLAAAQPPRIALPSVSTSLEGRRAPSTISVASQAKNPFKTAGVARSADPLFDTTTSSSSSASFQKSKMKRATPLVARAAEPDCTFTTMINKNNINPFEKVHQTFPSSSKKEMLLVASVQPRPIPLPSFSTNQDNLRQPQQQLRRSSLDHAVGSMKKSSLTSPEQQRRSSLSNAQQQLLLAAAQPKPIPLPALSIDGCMQRRPSPQNQQQHPQRRSSLSKSAPSAAATALSSPEMLASIQPPIRIPIPAISTQEQNRKPQHTLRRASLSSSGAMSQQEQHRRLSLSQSFSYGQTIENASIKQHTFNLSKSFNYGPPATRTTTAESTFSTISERHNFGDAKVPPSTKTVTPSSKSTTTGGSSSSAMAQMMLAAAQPMRIPLPSLSTHDSRQRRPSLAASAAASAAVGRRASLSKSSSFGASATEQDNIPLTNHHQRRCSLDSSNNSLMKSSPELLLASVQPRRIPLPSCSTTEDNIRQPLRRSSLSNSSPPSVALPLPLSSPEMLAAAQPVRIPLPSLSTCDERHRRLPSSSPSTVIKKNSSSNPTSTSLEMLAAAQPLRIPLPVLSTSDERQRRLPSPSSSVTRQQQSPQSPQPSMQQQEQQQRHQQRHHPVIAPTPNCTPIYSRNAVTGGATAGQFTSMLPFMFTPKPSPAMIEQSLRNLAQTTQETGALASEALLNTLTNTLQEDSFSSHDDGHVGGNDVMSSSPTTINTCMIGDGRAVSYPPYFGGTGAATAQAPLSIQPPIMNSPTTRGVVDLRNHPQTMRRASAA